MAVLAAVLLTIVSAQPIEEDVATLAAEHGLDAVELQGAVLTVQSTPVAYLQHEGLITRPAPALAVGPPVTNLSLWDRLAACESGGNWASNSNPRYKGGLQFDAPTWRSYGGLAYAPSAHLATKAQQIAVAERLRAARGLQPWPVCGRRV
jgi:hypothetical protein